MTPTGFGISIGIDNRNFRIRTSIIRSGFCLCLRTQHEEHTRPSKKHSRHRNAGKPHSARGTLRAIQSGHLSSARKSPRSLCQRSLSRYFVRYVNVQTLWTRLYNMYLQFSIANDKKRRELTEFWDHGFLARLRFSVFFWLSTRDCHPLLSSALSNTVAGDYLHLPCVVFN